MEWLHNYAFNNPLRYNDPDGRDPNETIRYLSRRIEDAKNKASAALNIAAMYAAKTVFDGINSLRNTEGTSSGSQKSGDHLTTSGNAISPTTQKADHVGAITNMDDVTAVAGAKTKSTNVSKGLDAVNGLIGNATQLSQGVSSSEASSGNKSDVVGKVKHDTTKVIVLTKEILNKAYRGGASSVSNIYGEEGVVGDTAVLTINHYTGKKLDSTTYHPGTYKVRK